MTEGFDGSKDVTNVLVAHHPYEEPLGFERGETKGARLEMARLAEARLHGLLTGHSQHCATGLGIAQKTPRAIFQMQTATALCTRGRERDHGFSVMDFDAYWLSITPWIINEASQQFEPGCRSSFAYRDSRWHVTL